MTEPTQFEKAIASETARALEADKPPILRMGDEARRSEVYVLRAPNKPQEGVVSYATVGLSGHPLLRNGDDVGHGVEIVAACGSAFAEFERVLATVAFGVINSKWFCAPGIVFPGVLDMLNLSTTMNDIYFAYPYLWGDLAFKSRTIEGRTVAWLQAIPISRDETAFAAKFGPKALEDLFEAKQIDVYNLNRPSVA